MCLLSYVATNLAPYYDRELGSKEIAMPIIALCNQKGGCGKTTLAINLAQAFVLEGASVVLVDLDPQGSASDWRAVSPGLALDFEVQEMDRSQLLRQARNFRRQYDVVIVDCPPQLAEPSAAAIRVADLVLVPVQPSPFDVWATDAVVELVKARQEASGGQPIAAYVVSRAISNTALRRSLSDALERQDLPVLGGGTTQRVVYATSAAHGKTVFDGPRSAARREMETIVEEIKEMLKGYDQS